MSDPYIEAVRLATHLAETRGVDYAILKNLQVIPADAFRGIRRTALEIVRAPSWQWEDVA